MVSRCLFFKSTARPIGCFRPVNISTWTNGLIVDFSPPLNSGLSVPFAVLERRSHRSGRGLFQERPADGRLAQTRGQNQRTTTRRTPSSSCRPGGGISYQVLKKVFSVPGKYYDILNPSTSSFPLFQGLRKSLRTRLSWARIDTVYQSLSVNLVWSVWPQTKSSVDDLYSPQILAFHQTQAC